MATEVQTTFFSRAAQLPVVQSATGQVSGWYTWAKDSNQYVNTGLAFVEQQAVVAAGVCANVAKNERVAPHLSALDNAASAGLETLVKSYPVLAEPTERIVANSKEAVSIYTAPAASALSATQQQMQERAAAAQAAFDAAKQRTNEALVALKEYSTGIAQKLHSSELDARAARVNETMKMAQEYVAQSVEASRAYATAQYAAAAEKMQQQKVALTEKASVVAHDTTSTLNTYTEAHLNVHIPNTQEELKETLTTITTTVAQQSEALQAQVTHYVSETSDMVRNYAKGYGIDVPTPQELSERLSALSAEVAKNWEVALSTVKNYMAPIAASMNGAPAPATAAA